MESSIKAIACELCKSNKLIKGTLEGVAFVPSRKNVGWWKKSSGIYGIEVCVCLDCGRLQRFFLDAKNLENIPE